MTLILAVVFVALLTAGIVEFGHAWQLPYYPATPGSKVAGDPASEWAAPPSWRAPSTSAAFRGPPVGAACGKTPDPDASAHGSGSTTAPRR